MTATTPPRPYDDPTDVVSTYLDITGPYDLREVALMGFGHRDDTSFDGVMRMAFCLDGDHERQLGVEARQVDDRLELRMHPAPGDPPVSEGEIATARRQVARVVSLDHDGEVFHSTCLRDPVLAQVHKRAPGFRPALFYSPFEALVWSVVSARRARGQGIALRRRLAQAYGATFDLGGVAAEAVPTPSALLALESLPGLPADRVPRLHAVAEAARAGLLSADRLRAMAPDEARAELQQLPGIGPFYSALVVVRACGHADVVSTGEGHSRDAVREAYGFDHDPGPDELLALAESWRPFRTWVQVMLRALADRTTP